MRVQLTIRLDLGNLLIGIENKFNILSQVEGYASIDLR